MRKATMDLLLMIVVGIVVVAGCVPVIERPGDLYVGFNQGQIMETEFQRFSYLEAIDVHASGRIYAFGTTWHAEAGNGKQVAISRYLSNGRLDTSYDLDGLLYYGAVTAINPTQNWHGVDMFVQPNEQLVLMTDHTSQLGSEKRLVRFNDDATRDHSFFNPRDSINWPRGNFALGGAITADPSGNITVCGHNDEGFWLTRRLYTDGSLDQSFGDSNIAMGYNLFPATDARCTDVAIDNNGRIIVTGWSFQNSALSFVLLRFNNQGDLDAGFGNGTGQVITSGYPHYPARINHRLNPFDVASVKVQADGQYVIAMTGVLERYDTDGNKDTSFGANGTVELRDSGLPALARDLVISPDGTILVTGMKAETDNVFVYSFNADGSPDTTFGINGRARIAAFHRAYALALRPDGQLLVGGRIYEEEIGPPHIIKWRFTLATLKFNSGRHPEAVRHIVPYARGLITAFRSGVVYYSPDGQNLGGGGRTIRVYGGRTIRGVYGGWEIAAMIPYWNNIITAFSYGAVFSSPNGQNLGGGGNTTLVYTGTQRVDAMIPYQTGVLTAFSDGSIYYSPDGQNLGGGGSTALVYTGTQRVDAMIPYQTGVLTAFSDGSIYYSPDGQNLGGGGSTTRVYGPGQQVVVMIPYQTGVLTAFSGGGIYYSPDGDDLGGGGNTVRVY
jgi:uncharacterized delta-60 repeat protein